MRRLLNRKGQSVLEYVIVLTAIVAGVIAASTVLKGKIEKSLGTTTDDDSGDATGAAGYIDDSVENLFGK